jgi:leucyl-tRNA synthetase
MLGPFILLLSPFAPHIAEELWERLGHRTSLAYEPWPSYDKAKLQRSTAEVVLQVNGKVRSRIEVAMDTTDKELEALCLADENVRRYLNGKKLVKVIAVKNKLVNVVVQ